MLERSICVAFVFVVLIVSVYIPVFSYASGAQILALLFPIRVVELSMPTTLQYTDGLYCSPCVAFSGISCILSVRH